MWNISQPFVKQGVYKRLIHSKYRYPIERAKMVYAAGIISSAKYQEWRYTTGQGGGKNAPRFSSWLSRMGQSLFSIWQLLGHSDMKMAVRFHPFSPGHLKAAVKDLEKYLSWTASRFILVLEKKAITGIRTLEKKTVAGIRPDAYLCLRFIHLWYKKFILIWVRLSK
jgi:hypothetical protein